MTPRETRFKNFNTFDVNTLKNKGLFTPEIIEMLMTLKNKGIYTPEEEFITPSEIKMTPFMYTPEMESMTMTPRTKYMSPLVTRMMEMNKVDKIDQLEKLLVLLPVEKKIELLKRIQNEKLIKEQFLNKDNINFYNIAKDTNTFNTIEKIEGEREQYHHIPLTFGKPTIGSGINEFQQKEQEIKY